MNESKQAISSHLLNINNKENPQTESRKKSCINNGWIQLSFYEVNKRNATQHGIWLKEKMDGDSAPGKTSNAAGPLSSQGSIQFFYLSN